MLVHYIGVVVIGVALAVNKALLCMFMIPKCNIRYAHSEANEFSLAGKNK